MLARARRWTPSGWAATASCCARAPRRSGVSHEPLRRNAGRCVQCSSCPTGCRLDAKRAMHVSYLPRAVAAGARVRAGVEAVAGSRSRAAARSASRAASPGRTAPHGRAPRRGRPRCAHAAPWCWPAGPSARPELLLRSGFRSPSGRLGRNLGSTPPAGSARASTEEVRGWDGVMQSYAVDEWEEPRTPARGDLHAAGLRRPVAARAPGPSHQERVLAYDRIASTGVHLSDRSTGRVRLARDGSLRISYRLTDDDAATARLRDRPRRRALLRGRRPRGLPADRRDPDDHQPPGSLSSRPRSLRPVGAATRGLPSDGHRADGRRSGRRGVVGTDGAVHGADGLYVADGSAAAELDRRQPDDDDHRHGLSRRPQLADRLN